MVIRKNKKNQTAYVGNVTPSGLGIFYSVPLKGAKVAQRLTIRSGCNVVVMSGSQVRALTRVISAARKAASR
jgi:hypothetical protein